MKQEIKDRVEARKKAYKDLCLWLNFQYKNEIEMLFGKSSFSFREWFNHNDPEIIDGAIVSLEIRLGFQSESMDYILQMLGAKRYEVTAYPLCRLQIQFWVPVNNPCKAAMSVTGTWTPFWKKYEKKDGNT